MAVALSARFRFPICRSAQFTALRDEVPRVARFPHDDREEGLQVPRRWPPCRARPGPPSARTRPASRTPPRARSTRTPCRRRTACRSKSVAHVQSTTSQVSKSFAQDSICRSVTRAGSSTMEARMRASWTPERHRSAASRWSGARPPSPSAEVPAGTCRQDVRPRGCRTAPCPRGRARWPGFEGRRGSRRRSA